MKQKIILSWYVEMEPEDAYDLASRMEFQRHNLNRRKGWDTSKDMPNHKIFTGTVAEDKNNGNELSFIRRGTQ